MSGPVVKGPASYFPSIEGKHGRPVAEWQQLLRAHPGYGAGAQHLELVTWLKTEHGLGHGHANAIVAHTLAEDRRGEVRSQWRAGEADAAGRATSRPKPALLG